MYDTDLSNDDMLKEVEKDLAGNSDQSSGQEPSKDSDQGNQKTQQEQIEDKIYEYIANGKSIKEPISMILKRASQGYNYAQLVHEHKSRLARIPELEEQIKGLAQYKEYDDYAKQNPAWREHVMKSWGDRHRFSDPNLDPDDPINGKLSQVMKMFEDKFNPLMERMNGFEKYINQSLNDKEYSSLQGEVDSVKKEFSAKGIDFETPDEFGKTLTTKILEHMQENKIPTFKAGFRDFYFDQLMDLERNQANTKVANELQKRNKNGIISKSPNPTNSKAMPNIKNMNYDQLSLLASKELEG